ncbi:MAG: hypothetical protein H0S85_06770 [Desulfovibrionaceae bacterium]|jgi:hypothetical protein|nr:hypothetical protein [Desulfovibrionaceae bacterium]
MKRIYLSAAMAFVVAFLSALPMLAHAEDDVAYFVARDTIFEQITGMRAYLANDGVKIVHITPDELQKTKGLQRFIVLGSPDDQDAIGDLIRKSLTEQQVKDARRMGKANLVTATIAGQDVMFFATSFSMKTLVKATAGSWREYFESWYGVTIPITQIIGY